MPFEILEDEAPAKAGGYEILGDDDTGAPVAASPATVGAVEGTINAFKRGNLAGQRAIEATQFKDEQPTMRQGRRAFVEAMEDPAYSFGILQNPEKFESLIGPGARLKAAMGPARESNIATAQNIAEATGKMEVLPQSPAMQEWSRADNSNWWNVFAKHPVEITANIFAESLPQAATGMAAGMAAGAAGGPGGMAAGAGVGSFAVEASNSFLAAAEQAGVNLKDPEQVRAFFTDESKVKEARQFAMERDFPVALFDALTAGMAGKFLKPAMGQGLGRVAVAGAKEAGMQMAGGAAGEAAAQVTSGQDLSAKDIAAEAIGELVTAPGEVVGNLREEFRNPGSRAQGKGFEVLDPVNPPAAEVTKETKETKEALPTGALEELQAAMRGNQLRPVPSPLIPIAPAERAAPSAEVRTVTVPAEMTEEQRAAVEFQRKTDEAVRAAMAEPDKNYEGMGTLDLELLSGMGDARATAELRRKRAERARASEQEFLDSLKPAEVAPRESYAGSLEDERPDSLLAVVNSTQRVAAPPLQTALDAMKAGKTPREVVKEWGGGRGDHDTLVDILEQLNVARQANARAQLNDLRKAYLKAFREGTRPNVDTAFKDLQAARDQGFAPAGGVPEDPGSLYTRLFDEATGKAGAEPSAQELGLYFLDTATNNAGRGAKRDRGTPVALDSLSVGDTLRIRGVELTVSAIDPDTDAVTFRAAEPGEFGKTQTLTPEQAPEIYPDFGSYRQVARETGGERFSVLDPNDFDAERPAEVYEADKLRGQVVGQRNRPGVERAVAALMAELPGIPDVTVVDGMYDLPATVVASIPEGTKPQGVVSGGRVYLVAETLPTEAVARRVALHEILGHDGMRAVLGEQFGPFMESVYREYVTSVDEAKNLEVRRLAYMYEIDTSTAEGRQMVGEEIVARLAEGELQAPTIWQRVVQAVKAWFRRITGGNITEEEIRAQLLKARERLRGGMNKDGETRFSLSEEEGDTRRQSLRAQIEALGAEMDGIRGRGESIPQEMLDRYKDMVDTLGEEIRLGRAPSGAGRGRASVDSDLQPRQRQAAGAAPAAGRPRTSPTGRIPQWKGEERLPGGRLRDIFTGLANWRRSTGDWLSRRGARADVVIGRDAGDNRAALAANMGAMNVRLLLNRALNTAPAEIRKKHAAREAALTFAIEADGNAAMLDEFYDRIGSSEFADSKAGRQALAAIEYAATHWDAMQAAAEQYKRLTSAQREMELNEGINSAEWEGGYVYHQWEKEPSDAGGDPTKAAPTGTPFRKSRSVPNYAEGIAEGRIPRTLNSIELLSDRIATGQRRLNELRWVHGLRSMLDPVTDEPVVVDVIRKPVKPVQTQQPRRADAESTAENWDEGYKPAWQVTAPAGYQVWRIGDLEVAVQNGFVGLLTKLTSQSFFKGNRVKKVFGAIKSGILLFDTFHMGRMAAWKGVITGNPFSYGKGQTLLDFTPSDITEMVRRGEVPESWGEELLENKRKLNLALETGFNVGNVLDNAWSDALHNLPGIGTFNKWLFGQYQRGAMAEAWLIEFGRMRKALPNATEMQVARRVSRDLNARFGNLNRQGLFKTRTAQDLVRFVFLAPQWNESLIRSELGALSQLARVPMDSYQQRRLVLGTLLRATGGMALGTFLANQILNYAFRGKPTWENDEEGWEAKISAWIPDFVGGGPGFFLNPLALPAEYTHLIAGNLHKSGGDMSEALRRVFASRLHPGARSVEIFATRKDALGRKLREGEVLPAMAQSLIPVPIGAVAPATAAKQFVTGQPSEKYPGQYQRQMLSTFGLKVDQAPSAEQRIRTLAKEFNRSKGIEPSAEFFAGDFSDLDKALRIGNMNDAREAMDEILQKKTPRQVYDHYKRSSAAPFTGQRGRESEFWRGLSAEQRARYEEARAARQKLARQAAELLKERVTARR